MSTLIELLLKSAGGMAQGVGKGMGQTQSHMPPEVLLAMMSPQHVPEQSFQGGLESPYAEIISRASKLYGVSPYIIEAMMNQESGGNPTAQSGKGAYGLMQLMPDTAKMLGVTNPADPEQNIMGGARYYKMMLDQFGSPHLALAAYNSGPGNVRKYGGIPPFEETKNYVRRIMGNVSKYGQQGY